MRSGDIGHVLLLSPHSLTSSYVAFLVELGKVAPGMWRDVLKMCLFWVLSFPRGLFLHFFLYFFFIFFFYEDSTGSRVKEDTDW